uniref:Organic solvent tolerance-like N-terminal domain-containing protein n=1 Tax=mine drainage metagenome TaxID=410659 RepID=E6PZD0_9ZZZZ
MRQTLDAKGRSHADPVSTVLAESRGDHKATPQSRQAGKLASKSPTRAARPSPDASVIRLTSGELHYSEGQRLAVFSSGAMGRVTAETSSSAGLAKILSDSAEVYFMDPGSHFASPSSSGSANSTVDRMISQGKVAVRWPGRIGTGEKLVYTSDDGLFTLTGSAAEPPRIRDLQHGTVTGSALIFNSQDDSVTVEGNGGSTTTDTRTPR